MINGLQSLYVPARDFAASLDFYRKVLGVREAAVLEWGAADEKGAFFELPGGVRLILAGSKANRDLVPSPIWLEFEVDDVDAHFQRLKGLGIPLADPPYLGAGGARQFRFADPSGHPLSISSRWPTPKAAMKER
jgi:catechol 2,3-dioxygenase-like lactoylglutathione lyase family enzyme